jgi:hypothetical protein
MGMDATEELKVTYKFEWEKKIVALRSRDWSSEGSAIGN